MKNSLLSARQSGRIRRVSKSTVAYCFFSSRFIARTLCAVTLSAVADFSVAAPPTGAASADLAVEFDTDLLRSRGIDPALAEYFRHAPRFREGVRVVTLFVNGARRGLTEARFDGNGELCFTKGLLDKAGLRIPPLEPGQQGDLSQACHAFLAEYLQARVTLRPNQEEVALLVPTQALHEDMGDAAGFSEGGTAGVFNYDLLGLDSQSGSTSSRHFSASTLAGFNVGNWIVRSRQQFFSGDERERFEHVYAYGQRDVHPLNSTFQVGQINSASPLFAGIPISGLQLLPSYVARGQESGGALVEGVASSQSRIEVRQSGALIYSTLVPEGPFTLSSFPLLNGSSDLQVRVIGVDGAERQFTVPAASFHGVTQERPGYYLALGQVRSISGQNVERDPVATLSGSWGLGTQALFSGGVMGASGYQAGGWGLDSRLFQRVDFRWRNMLAQQAETDSKGVQASLSLSGSPYEGVSLGMSATLRSQGFRDLLDTEQRSASDERLRFRSQYTLTSGWADPQLGGFGLSYSRSALVNGQSVERLSGSWGKSFKYASVSLNVESGLGSSRYREHGSTAMYLGISVPLGGSRHSRSYASRRGERLTVGTSLTEQVNDSLNYRLGVERDGPEGDSQLSGNLGITPRYTQVNLGVARNESSSSYFGHLKGGIAVHDSGLTFSPYAIADTFGIVSVGDLTGVKVATPYGPVWTDGKGQAVIASLPAYSRSRVEVATKTLPRQVDIKNGYQQVEAGRGSFNNVRFEVLKVRRVLLQVRDEQGKPLSPGASVLTVDNQFLTTVVAGGKVFLSNIDNRQVLKVVLPDSRGCELQLDLPAKTDIDQLYETAEVICRAS